MNKGKRQVSIKFKSARGSFHLRTRRKKAETRGKTALAVRKRKHPVGNGGRREIWVVGGIRLCQMCERQKKSAKQRFPMITQGVDPQTNTLQTRRQKRKRRGNLPVPNQSPKKPNLKNKNPNSERPKKKGGRRLP